VAVNDGKFVDRLRSGGRVTSATLARVQGYIAADAAGATGRGVVVARRGRETAAAPPKPAAATGAPPPAGFRFFDNRQKYLLFVNTCSEKWVIAQRVALELANLHPRPPALLLFDAGVGDGTVLTRAMRAMHHRFPAMPFHIVGKEISLEDIRLTLEKMPDRFFEHPATVLVLTNLNYAEAPWLRTRSPGCRASSPRTGAPMSAPRAATRSTNVRSCWFSIAPTIASCSTR
jgi:hypothetical protein